MEIKRHENTVMNRAHHDTSDIVRILEVDRHTVYRVCKRLKDGESLKNRPRSGRQVKLTPEAARTTFKDNPKMTMTEFTEKKYVARTTVSNDVKAAGRNSKRDNRIVQTWMKENMKFWPKDFWPPQSTDLNPLDYSVWWQVESKACRVRHGNVKDLKVSVDKEWDAMSKCYVANVCTAFRHRVVAAIKAKGGHIHK
ncbi:Putative transposable element [Caligus rogercresseyi]|uniref:Transposable element n=1 Tax=Caligus rogercresseyi TaxID=217165 RepID=A0A7T8QTH5_CALRO|nr:Putative transposable element [Caligus rogercresseyi]